MNALAPIHPKLDKLIPRLGSDVDGEIVSTVRAIDRTLRAAGLDWHDLTAALHQLGSAEAEPDWHAVAVWCRDAGANSLCPREAKLFSDMCRRLVLCGRPTVRQANWLRVIYARLGGAA